jgi:hypothetical protein
MPELKQLRNPGVYRVQNNLCLIPTKSEPPKTP